MSDLRELFRQAERIAREEGVLDAEPSTQRMFPEPGRARRFDRVAERVRDEVLKSRTENDSASGAEPNRTAAQATSDVSVLEIQTQEEQVASSSPVGPSAAEILDEQLEFLGVWTKQLLGAARSDFWRYWAFKLPALTGSVSTSALEAFGYGSAVIVLGVVSALCIGLDAAFPGGTLHNVHKRAAAEARRLQANLLIHWRKVQLEHLDEKERRQRVIAILDEMVKERTRIDAYVTDAEASLGGNTSTSGTTKSQVNRD